MLAVQASVAPAGCLLGGPVVPPPLLLAGPDLRSTAAGRRDQTGYEFGSPMAEWRRVLPILRKPGWLVWPVRLATRHGSVLIIRLIFLFLLFHFIGNAPSQF